MPPEDQEFCEQLGRAVLAAGKLEAELRLYLAANSITHDTKRASLGQLIELVKQQRLLRQMQPVLELLRDQRNYLTHNVYPLFAGLIEETILPRSDLVDSDVDVFTERASQLAYDLYGIARIVAGQNTSN